MTELERRSEKAATALRWWLVLAGVVLVTIGCDRAAKHVATTVLAGAPDRSYLADTVRLAYAENAGGFLSLGASLPAGVRTGIFTVATGLALLGLTVVAVRQRHARWPTLGLTLFVSGGLSNWIDRFISGSVVDFMIVGVGPLRTGIFNLADVAILLGAGLFLLGTLRGSDSRQR